MPRKTRHLRERDRALPAASMRPRPDAAENSQYTGHMRRRMIASMRPRPDAAENQHDGRRETCPRHASMRPRPDAAENEPS